MSISVDYAFFPKVQGRDIVYYGKRGADGIMCAGMSMCDAVIIADTPEELLELAVKYKRSTIDLMDSADVSDIVPYPITWQTLTSEWRWLIYKDKARFIIGGIDFCATAITNTPGRESAITCDPTTVVFVGANDQMEYLNHEGCVVIGQDVPDLLMQLSAVTKENNGMKHIVCVPLMVFAQDDADVWYNRTRHNVREALEKNPVLLLGSFSDLSLDQISEHSEMILNKLRNLGNADSEEETNEN